MKRILTVSMIGIALLATGCTNMSKTQQGALSGGAIGALGGAGIAAIAGGSGTTGALIGGAVGAVAGGVVGHNK